MRSMVALLSGLGTGYLDQQDRNDEKTRRAKLDQITFDRAARDTEQYDRTKRLQGELDAAAAPITPESGEVYQPAVDDDGNAMPANPTAGTGMVNGRRFPTMEAASAAANSPQETRARMLPVLNRQNPQAAATMEAADMQLDAAKSAATGAKFDKELLAAAAMGPQGVIDFTNASQITPTQAKFVVDPDSKTGTVHLVMPDGTLKPTAQKFSNDAAGARDMALVLSQQVPLTEKLKHYLEVKKADSVATYQDRMGRAALGKVDNASDANSIREHATINGKPGAAGSRRGDQFDEKQWSAVHKIEPSFVSIDDEAGKPRELPELRQVYRSAVNRLRERGDVGPDEAAEQARTTVLQLREQAEADVAAARAADKKSTLTVQQAVKNIVKEFDEAKKPKPAAPAAPKTAVGKAVAAAPPGGIVLDKASGAYKAQGMAAAAGAAAPASPASPAPTSTAGADPALAGIEARNIEAVRPLLDAVRTAEVQLAAVAKSGDPKALQQYAAALQRARDARDAALAEKFGNAAPRILKSLGQ